MIFYFFFRCTSIYDKMKRKNRNVKQNIAVQHDDENLAFACVLSIAI